MACGTAQHRRAIGTTFRALFDSAGGGVVVRGFGRPAQPFDACPGRLGARFRPGDFVFCFRYAKVGVSAPELDP